MSALSLQPANSLQSYVKARGDGLGFEPLSRAKFVYANEDPWSARARVVVDGKPCPRWSFSLHALPHGHWVAVAQGDPQDVVDAHQVDCGDCCLLDRRMGFVRPC